MKLIKDLGDSLKFFFMGKSILLTVLLIAFIGGSVFVASLIPHQIASNVVGAVLMILSIRLSFMIYDSMYPSPANLSTEEVKSFFASKTFWGAFIILLITTWNGLLPNAALEPGTNIEILELDWANIGKALMAVLMIVVRKIDIWKLIKG